jgi:hypothetical protein
MNFTSQGNGLSARRKAIDSVKKIVSWFSRIVKRGAVLGFIGGTAMMTLSCHEKTNGQDTSDAQKDQASVVQDSTKNQPKVSIKVNKRYDDKGNLVGFDSTYSSFYSNVEGDTARMDSLMNSFDRYFNRNHSSFFDHQFNTLFFNDSLRYPDFFHNDFFMKRYELNHDYLKGMMHRMDSIKNRFYQEQNRKLKDSQETDHL